MEGSLGTLLLSGFVEEVEEEFALAGVGVVIEIAKEDNLYAVFRTIKPEVVESVPKPAVINYEAVFFVLQM